MDKRGGDRSVESDDKWKLWRKHKRREKKVMFSLTAFWKQYSRNVLYRLSNYEK